MLLNLFLVYIGSVFIILGVLKLGNNNETFGELSTTSDPQIRKLSISVCLIPVLNTILCLTFLVTLLITCSLKYGKIDKGLSKIRKIIEKVVE